MLSIAGDMMMDMKMVWMILNLPVRGNLLPQLMAAVVLPAIPAHPILHRPLQAT